MGKFLSVFDRVTCLPHDRGIVEGYHYFTFLFRCLCGFPCPILWWCFGVYDPFSSILSVPFQVYVCVYVCVCGLAFMDNPLMYALRLLLSKQFAVHSVLNSEHINALHAG